MSKISFDGVGAVVATFFADKGVKGGQVVKLTGNGRVGPCAAGDLFCGVALEPRGGMAAVQVKGFATVSGTGLSVGRSALVADGQGGVKIAEGAASVSEETETTTTAVADGVTALVVSVESGGGVVCL